MAGVGGFEGTRRDAVYLGRERDDPDGNLREDNEVENDVDGNVRGPNVPWGVGGLRLRWRQRMARRCISCCTTRRRQMTTCMMGGLKVEQRQKGGRASRHGDRGRDRGTDTGTERDRAIERDTGADTGTETDTQVHTHTHTHTYAVRAERNDAGCHFATREPHRVTRVQTSMPMQAKMMKM